MMIDLNCHILPGMDDGAKDMKEAVEMARIAAEDGIGVVVASPSCNVPGKYDNYFGKEYMEIFQDTQRVLLEKRIPVKLLPGMDVFVTDNLPRLLDEGRVLTMNQTSCIMLEFARNEEPDFVNVMLQEVRRRKYIPLIAHPETYEFVQANPQSVEKWIREGCLIQVNKGSFQKRYGRAAEQTAHSLLLGGMVTAIASDARGALSRRPMMSEVYARFRRWRYSEKNLEKWFYENPKKICGL